MVTVRIAVCTAAIFGTIHCASAGNITGNDLLGWCNGQQGKFFDGMCSGYIRGVFEMEIARDAICNFEGVTGEQSQDIVVQYLQTHPEVRHKLALILIHQAVVQAFPCSHK